MMNIILGGTHGLGGEIAKILKESGDSTWVAGRTYDKNVHGNGIAADLSDPDDIARVKAELAQVDIDAFYWVAGFGYQGDFADQPGPDIMAEVNFGNALTIIQDVWKHLLSKNTPTKLAIVSSSSGIKARPNEAVYAATKHAQVGFARSLGLESERLGSHIKVSLFLPGGMQTSFWNEGRPDSYESFLDPGKVAQAIVQDVRAQDDYFYEREIERGSL